MSLHLDYRPQNLDEIIGNQETILKLEKQLLNSDGPHVFLFSGPKGCGKTTLGRIASEIVGCDERDIHEVDVADKENRGTAAATELKNGVRYSAMFGKVKAYILDECHMMTTAYGNSLLKTLEDTPKHVYFFLCTTDPQKLLGTVKSRCSQYEVNVLTQKEIIQLLNWVIGDIEARGIELNFKKEELKKISEVCDGIPREALIILDQVIDLDPKDRLSAIENTKVRERELIELCRALLERKKWKPVSNILKGLKGEPESIRMGILNYMNTVLLGGNEDAALIMEEFREPCYNRALLTLACYMSLK